MHEPQFEEDERDVVEERVRIGRSYVRLALPVLLTVGVLLVGFLGTRSSPAAVPSARPTDAVAQATATPNGLFFGRPLVTTNPDPALPDFLAFAPANTITHVDLPRDVSSLAISTLTRRLFYVVSGTRIQTVALASGAMPETLVSTPPCRAIEQLAVAGQSILYVVIAPIGLPLHDTDCGNSSRFSWTIWRYDLSTGTQAQLAEGAQDAPPSWDTSMLVHLAATPTAFAFERESIAQVGGGATVEVHSLDGKLLWTTTSDAPVGSLMLGRDRVAIVTHEDSPRLELAAESDRSFAQVAVPLSGAHLSSDGSYLAWDAPDPDDPSRSLVMVRALDQGGLTVPIASTPVAPPLESPRPVVANSVGGPEVAWYARLSDGTLAPAFVDPSHPTGALLRSAQLPTWLGFIGDDLVWVVSKTDGSGSVAAIVDLPSTGNGDAP